MNEGSVVHGLSYLLDLTRWLKPNLAENAGSVAAHLRWVKPCNKEPQTFCFLPLPERSLNGIVQKIIAASHLNLPKVTCRILATTPVEMFHVNDTILVSRGLLEMVPDESMLAVLLGHELAHIVVGSVGGGQVDAPPSVFEYNQSGEFPGLGITNTAEEE
jgi:hypothetical protein